MTVKFLCFVTSLLSLLSCQTNSKASESKEPSKLKDFRNISWNMTKEEVLKNETANRNEFVEDTSALLFDKIELFGKNFKLGYAFDSSKLKQALYFTELTALDNVKGIYQSFKEFLYEKYGKATIDTIVWGQSVLSLPEEKRIWYSSVIIHELEAASAWRDTISYPNRVVLLNLENKNGKVIISCVNAEINYYSRMLKQNKTRMLNNF